MSIQKVLIANRGEIVSRISNTLRRMGKRSVGIYSDLDVGAEYLTHVDEAICIGGSAVKDSYCNIEVLLHAINDSGADAVHPGYGFVSENPEFVSCLERKNITFIGPSADSVAKMSDKVMAKKIAKEAGVTLIPGHIGEINDYTQALEIAESIGFPILIKASAGGGGKGMRIVNASDELRDAMRLASSEAMNFFGDSRIFMEKYLKNPRHIEVQILADKHGHVICLGERECSIQRRHQKVIEEAPSPIMDARMRKAMYEQSISLAKSVGYFSAGTVEYIVDQNMNFYFMEMNTRIQVEHPVTEMITGVDIVEEMVKIAEGKKLSRKSSVIKFNGWSFESRVYAEDPLNNFMPTSGFISDLTLPEDARVESSISTGCEVTMFYDPMVMKITVHGKSREDAIQKSCNALMRTSITGLKNNLVFLESVFRNEYFISGSIDTRFIDTQYKDYAWYECAEHSGILNLIAVSLYAFRDFISTENNVVMLGSSEYEVSAVLSEKRIEFNFAGSTHAVSWEKDIMQGLFIGKVNDAPVFARIFNTNHTPKRIEYNGLSLSVTALPKNVHESYMSIAGGAAGANNSTEMCASMTGMIADVYISVGDEVRVGDPVCVIEAMKMQNTITAERDGRIEEIYIAKGQDVTEGETLLKFAKN